MKSIFDDTARAELIKRIETLSGGENASWGKMNVAQMVEHCIRWEEVNIGKIKVPRLLLGRLFGKLALKSLLREKPIREGIPTLKELVVTETPADFGAQIEKWIALINDYPNHHMPYYTHPFCGKMTREQTGIMAYKHTDHHLRQFGR